MCQERADVTYSVKNSKKNYVSNRERRDESEAYCEILESRSECKEPDRNHCTFEVRERVYRQRLGRASNNVQEHKWRSCAVVKCKWSRTQHTESLSSAEADFFALTTGVGEGMVTKHLLQELGHEVILMNHVDSQSAKVSAYKRELGRMKHVMLKYMYVQEVVEKSLTHLAYISTKQNKADLLTKCHTSEAHKRGCAMIGLRLA